MVDLNTLEVQEGKLGRKFRASSVKRFDYSEWCYIFRYIDDGSFFGLVQMNGQITRKLTHKEVLSI
jgi:hypothetical protein